MVRKATWKHFELHLPGKIVNQKECCIPGGAAEISSTVKDLKDGRVMVPRHLPLAPLVGHCRRQMDREE